MLRAVGCSGNLRVQLGDGTGGGDGDGGHDFSRLAMGQGLDGGAHRGAGGQAVVDQEDCASPDWCGWASAAEKLGAMSEFTLLLTRDLSDSILVQPLLGDDFLVDDLDTALGDGTEGQFGLAGNAELAYQPDVEGRIQSAGDLAGDGYSSPGETEYQGIDSLQLSEHVSEQRSGVAAVAEMLGSCACHATASEADVADGQVE